MELCNDVATADAPTARPLLLLSYTTRPSSSSRFSSAGANTTPAADAGRVADRCPELLVAATTGAFIARSPTLSTGRRRPSSYTYAGLQQLRPPVFGASKFGCEFQLPPMIKYKSLSHHVNQLLVLARLRPAVTYQPICSLSAVLLAA